MINNKQMNLGIIFLMGILLMMSFSSAASYMRTNYYSGSGASFVDSSSYYLDKQTCEAGEDFLIQIAPFGCTPAVVRSDLLEEQNVPVFCQLAATKINPLIEVDAIESISFSGQYPQEVSGVGFHPAQAALGVKGDLNSPILNNIGYAVIVLKKNENESSMPDFVRGNLTAKIKYDINNAFGIGRASFYLPEMTEDEFTNNKDQYSFWEKKGYLRADSIDNEGAVISIYDKDRKVASVDLKKGETSGKISLPTLDDCLAKLQLRLDSFENPDTRAKLNINGEIVEVGDEEWFLENRCQVKEITKQGINEKVKITCKEDESSSFFAGKNTFDLMISPRVNLTICDYETGKAEVTPPGASMANAKTTNCQTNTYTIGDYLFETPDSKKKSVYLGYVESKKDSQGKDTLYTVFYAKPIKEGDKLSEDEINSMARQVRLSIPDFTKGGVATLNVIQGILGKIVGKGIKVGKNWISGEDIKILSSSDNGENIFNKQVNIIGFAEPVDIDLEKLGSSSAGENRKKFYAASCPIGSSVTIEGGKILEVVKKDGTDSWDYYSNADINKLFTENKIKIYNCGGGSSSISGEIQRTDLALRVEKVLNKNEIDTKGLSDAQVIENYKTSLTKKRFGNDEVEVILNAKECSNCGDGAVNFCGAQECAEIGVLLEKDCHYELPSGCKDGDKEKVDLQKLNSALQGITELIVVYGGEKKYSFNNDIKNFVEELGASGILTERELEDIKKGEEKFGVEGSYNVGEKNLNEIEEILQDKKSSNSLSGNAILTGNVIEKKFDASSCKVGSSLRAEEGAITYSIDKIGDNLWRENIDDDTLTDSEIYKIFTDGKIVIGSYDSSCEVVSSTPTTSTSSTDIKSYYTSAVKDYDTIINSFPTDKLANSDASYGEEALSNKIELGFALGQKKTIIDWCNQFKEKYPESKKTLSSFCQDKSKLASSSISSRDVSINGRIKQISLEGIYEPSPEDYSVDILVKGPDGQTKSFTLTKDQIVYLDDFRKETLFYIEKNKESMYFEFNNGKWIGSLDGKIWKEISKWDVSGGDIASVKSVFDQLMINLKNNQNLEGGKALIEKEGGVVSRTNEFIQLVDLDDSYAVLNMNLRPQDYLESLKQAITSTNSKLNDNVPTSFGSGYVFTISKINLKKSAKVSVIPSIDNAGTETSFSFQVGIDKRDIQLSPEKTREKIASLNETIAQWEDRSEKLGNVVKGLKASCLSVGAFLTVKNLYLNTGGKAIARQEVMRGENGWYQKCADAVGGKGSLSGEGYKSINECLTKQSDNIDRDVSRMEGVIKEQNSQIQLLQKGCEGEEGFFTETHIDSECFIPKYYPEAKKDVKEWCNENNFEVEVDNVGTKVLCSEIVERIDKDSASIEQVRNLQRASMLGDKATLSKELNDIYANTQKEAEIKSLAESMNVPVGAAIPYSDKDTVTWDVTNPQKLSDYNKNIECGNNVKDCYYLVTKKGPMTYLATYGSKGVIMTLYERNIDGEWIQSRSRDLDNVQLKVYTEGLYNNKYSEPTLSYYETEPSKGLPAIVPFDCTNGWYVSAKQVTGAFGGFSAYDESGVARNYYICNVGPNKKEENQGGDDICQLINKGTGQPDVFSELDPGKAKTLGKAAESALVEASRKYKTSGSGGVDIGNCRNLKIGSPAVDIPDMQCQDFMSPKDCQLMFNVCDPVVCPSSRCDFGGTYPVKDVIQSGIVGSVLLCSPNAREGIYIPVCLSGIKAGIDGLLSVFHSYRDCLQESLDTGKMVGVCDEIYSIHLCEFFWRQSLPLAKIIIPKMMEVALGQNVRGGGEYMGVATAWANAEKSIDYFAQYYAATSYQAFKARIAEGVGDAVCQNSISASYPDGGSVLDSLTDPDSPPQFHGRFDEIEFTTATNPPISQYKVYYHIYAGKESRAYFQVYLKGDTGSSFYQDVSGKRPVASGYIATGEYASETKDFTAPSGYKQLCINVNGQEECGFQEVSTSFAINYVEDKYKEEQALQTDIKSEQECVSGSASAYSLLTPNLQSAGEELINPEIYNHGIIRICATNNPGKGTDGNAGMNGSRWVEVGYCDKTNNIRCWQDQESVRNTIKSLDIEGNVLSKQANNTLAILMAEGNYITDFKKLSTEIGKLEGVAKIDKITSVIDKVFYNAQKAYLYLKRGEEYGKLASVGKSKSDSEKVATVEPKAEEPVPATDNNAGSSSGGDVVVSEEEEGIEKTCQQQIGNQIIETIKLLNLKNKYLINDAQIKADTGAKNFECLILQLVYQESHLQHCVENREKDCFYCEKNIGEVLKSSLDEKSYGVMQINTEVHQNELSKKGMDVSILGDNIQYGIEYLIKWYDKNPRTYKCGDPNSKNYAGWKRALRFYNGWNTDCSKGNRNYVEEITGEKLRTIKSTSENVSLEVKKLFPELCCDGTVTGGTTVIPPSTDDKTSSSSGEKSYTIKSPIFLINGKPLEGSSATTNDDIALEVSHDCDDVEIKMKKDNKLIDINVRYTKIKGFKEVITFSFDRLEVGNYYVKEIVCKKTGGGDIPLYKNDELKIEIKSPSLTVTASDDQDVSNVP